MVLREHNGSDHELAIIPAPLQDAIVGRADDIVAVAEVAKEPSLDVVAEAAEPDDRLKRLASLSALFVTLFVAALNITVIGNVIPTICRDLDSAAGYAWVGGAFVLGATAFAPIWAKFSDIWGRKAILLTTVAGFFCCSIICALAVNMKMLIASRALQGVFGGGQVQIINIVISDLFSMRHRSMYLGLMEIVWALAGGLGPILGGAFAQHLSWRWIFWIMLPPGAISFFLLLFTLNVHNPRTKLIDGLKAVDWAGSFCVLALLVMLLLGLSLGGVEYPWNSPTVICLIVFGALMTFFLILSEKKLARYPLIPIDIFKDRSNVAAIAVGFAHDFGLFAGEYYLPFFFQSAKAQSPVASGLLMLPNPISMSLTGLLAGLYIHRTGRYVELLWLGQALMAAGHGAFLRWDATSPLSLTIPTQILAGVGTGMLFAPPLIALQANVPQDKVATTTAMMGLWRNVATVLSVVLGQTIFQHGMSSQRWNLQAAGLSPELLETFSGSQAVAKLDVISTISDPVQKLAVEQAYASSLRGIWITNVSLLALGFCCSFFVVKSKLSEEHVETKTGLKEE